MAELDSNLTNLDPRVQAFVSEILIDDDPYRAAMRVGFPVNALDADADDPTVAELMQDPRVQRAISAAKAQRDTRVAMTQQTVLHEMSMLSHSSINHYLIDDDGYVTLAPGAPDGAMRAIQSIKRKKTIHRDPKTNEETTEVTVEIKLWDKPNPLKLMGRQIGLFPDRVEHTGKGGGPIETVSRVERVIVDPQQPSL